MKNNYINQLQREIDGIGGFDTYGGSRFPDLINKSNTPIVEDLSMEDAIKELHLLVNKARFIMATEVEFETYQKFEIQAKTVLNKYKNYL